MQVGLGLRSALARRVAILATLFAGLTIGGSLGCTLKLEGVIPGAAPAIVVPAQGGAAGDSCNHVVHRVETGC